MKKQRLFKILTFVFLAGFFMINCANEESSSSTAANGSTTAATKYTVGGTLNGLTASGLVLQNNSSDDLTIASGDTSFTFATSLADGATYSVTVKTQPTGLLCNTTNASGSISSANVTNVSITCKAPKKVFVTASSFDGAMSGLTGVDSRCAMDSNKPATGTYKAFISDGTNRIACTTDNCSGGASEHKDWVLAADTTYTRVDGTVLFTTNSVGIVTSVLSNKITESASSYWTGISGATFKSSTNNCGSWNSNSSSYSGAVGSGSNIDSLGNTFGLGNGMCEYATRQLLCIEQ